MHSERWMRLFVGILFVAFLSGCVGYLPVSGDTTRGRDLDELVDLDALIGKTEDEIQEQFSSMRLMSQQISENSFSYRLYHHSYEFGLFFLIVAGPYGGGGGIAEYVQDRTSCYRFMHDSSGKLIKYEQRSSDTEKLILHFSSRSIVDCRLLFWDADQLDKIRKVYESRAELGDRDSAVFLAREFGDTGPLTDIARQEASPDLLLLLAQEFFETQPLVERAIHEKDINLAFVLAENYEIDGPLKTLAETNDVAAKKLEAVLAKRRSSSTLSWVYDLSDEDVEELAESGDPEDQYQIYLSGITSDRLSWLCLSADQGYPQAQYELGHLYWFGGGELQVHHVLAYKWYKKAAQGGLYRAKVAVGRMEETMDGSELEEARSAVSDWIPGHCEVDLEEHRVKP